MGYSNGLLESEVKGGSGERGEQGLPGIGFKLTDDGNFDIDGKRLTDVSQPVDSGDATTKAYVDGEIGHHTGNFYHLRQSFTCYDSSGTELALSTDSIIGLVTDYGHGYYKIPKSGDESTFSTLDIKIRNNLPKSTYSALFYLYGYRNNRKMSGVDLGPILFDVDGTNYKILKYDDDDSTETTDHTKAIIWFTADGSAGSIELGLRFFDKSITHFVILSRCVEGKINLGFSIDIFNVAYTSGDVTLYFEDINMNSRKIKNLGGPTGDGDVANKKYVDIENAKQDIAIADKASKSYVDGEISKVHIDTTPLLPRDGSRKMTGDLDMDRKHILSLENLDDHKVDDAYEDIVRDLRSAVNKEYLNEKFLKKDKNDNYFDLRQKIVRNCEPYYDGLFSDNDLVSKAFVQTEIAKLPKPATDLLKLDGSKAMTGNLDMGDHTITGIRSSAADNAALTVGGAKATYLSLLGDRSMQDNLNMGGHAIINIKPFVEDDSSQAASDARRNEVINFGYFHTERGELKRLINDVSSKDLNRKNPDPMEDDIDMANHSIINLKDPQPSDASYAASANFVNNTIGGNNLVMNNIIKKKIQESEERSIQAVQQENVFEKVMVDDLFK